LTPELTCKSSKIIALRFLTTYFIEQPSLNNFPKELSCEEDHSQALIYKKLWIDAERANCALKYQLKQTRLEIDLESSRAHTCDGPRIPPSHLLDTGRDPSSSYGSAITSPLMLEDHPGAGAKPEQKATGVSRLLVEV